MPYRGVEQRQSVLELQVAILVSHHTPSFRIECLYMANKLARQAIKSKPYLSALLENRQYKLLYFFFFNNLYFINKRYNT